MRVFLILTVIFAICLDSNSFAKEEQSKTLAIMNFTNRDGNEVNWQWLSIRQ